MERIPIVNLLFPTGSLSTSTVKPLLEYLSIVGQHLIKRLAEHIVVVGRAIRRMVTIPWRYIDSKLETIFTTRLLNLL